MEDPFILGGERFTSRLLMGSSGFPNQQAMLDALDACGAEIVTVAIRRINLSGQREDTAFLLDGKCRLLPQTDRDAALLGINSDLPAARVIGAASLHLPAAALGHKVDAAHLLLGASVHDAGEVEAALEAGADYLLAAPVFETASKTLQRPPLGLAGLRAIAGAVPVPVIALGGILPERAPACLQAGAAGVAAMGAVMRADDPALVVRAFLEAMPR
jgi:thiamine-phosphate pyrophosphorylase